MVTIYRAALETRNFSFEALGGDEDEATSALERAFNIHAKQYKLQVTWVDPFREDIKITALTVGASYRDGEKL